MIEKIGFLISAIGCAWFLIEAYLEKKGFHKWNWRNKVPYIPVFVGGVLNLFFLFTQ